MRRGGPGCAGTRHGSSFPTSWCDRGDRLSGLPYDAAKNEEISRKERRDALWRLWVAGFGMMQVMMYAYPVYIADGDMTADIESLMRWASLLLTMPVIFYSSAPFFRNAWRDIKLRRVGMDVPVALGVGAAFMASCWATLAQAGEVYFDSVTMFVFFLLGGRYLEMTARQKALSVTEALAKLLPAFAQKMPKFPADRSIEQCVVADLHRGDYVLVRAGDIVPADGRIIEGVSCANEALLTGESKPVRKIAGRCGDRRFDQRRKPAGRASRAGWRGYEAVGHHPVDGAGGGRKAENRRIGRSYRQLFCGCPACGRCSCGGRLVSRRSIEGAVDHCLGTGGDLPLRLVLGYADSADGFRRRAGQGWLLVTRGHAIETLARATHFVFDKTGTLTTGRMHLVDVLPTAGLSKDECLAIAAALEHSSEHPVANALRQRGGRTAARDIRGAERTGAGHGSALSTVAATASGVRIYALGLGAATCRMKPGHWLDSGDTVVALGDARHCLALFRIGDEIRPESRRLLPNCVRPGKHVVLLTGDAENVARRVAG
jgi:Cu2+-exporting ATPase